MIDELELEVPAQLLVQGATLPQRSHIGDAGYDLYSPIDWNLKIDEVKMFPLGFILALPIGTVGLVCSRSGLASTGVVVANAPGVIDSGYRGEVGVLLRNVGRTPYQITKNRAIAQLVVVPYVALFFKQADHLSQTDRGPDGWGSTDGQG